MTDATELPTVVGATELSNSSLGRLVEVCFATEDLHRAMEGLVRVGIGPWRVYTFDAATVQDRTPPRRTGRPGAAGGPLLSRRRGLLDHAAAARPLGDP